MERRSIVNAPCSLLNVLSWPHSRVGAVSVALAVLFLAVLGLNLGTSGSNDQNGILVFATFLTALGALAGMILSIIAIVRRHERSLLVFLPMVIGVLVVVFFAVEIFGE
jgi:hypothetical protein